MENTAAQHGGANQFGVVVGVDGSEGSWTALDWAAAAAAQRGTGLRIMYAMVDPFDSELKDVQERVSSMLVEAEKRARDANPGLNVRTAAFEGGPVHTLTAESETADLLVVGTRGRGGFASLVLGSTSVGVSARAACPVVVVPGSAEPTLGERPRIVVGVDGSELSDDALRYALRETARTGGGLTVAYGWQLPAPMDPMALSAAGYTMNFAVFEERTRRFINDVVDRARTEESADVPVEIRIAYQHPVEVLVDASENADLLVVGSHGRGNVTGLLLGSVSQAVLHRSRVPVVVVRHSPKEG